MGLVDRLNRVVRANLHALLGSDDPGHLIDQAITALRDGVQGAKRDLVTARGHEKRLQAEAEQRRKEEAQWEERARLALRNGDEALAREALLQKRLVQDKADQTAQSANAHQHAAQELERTIARMEQEAQELTARKASLIAEVMLARTKPQATPSELSSAQARVAALEAEVEAASVLKDPREADLEARFRALESQNEQASVEDQLKGLKEQLANDEKD